MADQQVGGIRGEAVNRARDAWRPLWARYVSGGRQRRVVRDRRGRRAALWPLSQVVHAAALLEPLGVAPGTVAPLLDGVQRFRTGRGWTASPWPGPARRVYYDDNAWLGLAGMQSWLMTGSKESLAMAVAAESVARRGEDPAGGLRWNERTSARHACSTAPTLLLSLHLAQRQAQRRDGSSAGGGAGGSLPPGLAEFAERSLDFLDTTLGRSDGLVADNLAADGTLEEHAWSYNQGATIGAHLLASQVLGRRESLERAQRLAAAAVDHLGVGDRLWREPPAFVAIFLRQLMALDAALATHRWQGLVDRYLNRVWLEGRDRQTGLFTAGGIGSYDEGVVIDQAAIVQLCAVVAMPVEWRRLAC